MTIHRRAVIGSAGLCVLAGGAFGLRVLAAPTRYEVSYSEAEWRKRLTPQQFAVLRKAATERAYTSPLDKEKRAGTFICAGCGLPLYSSKTKFESGTGWPSFWRPLPNAVATSTDWKIGVPRTEVHCRRCGGHLGHVFDDGPRPTGKRYCMNGVAMKFVPA
ncbi:peptide-methionine (R)-S-oxide reductase MsrB [Sphingomonas cavernae]|uniref:peptide-methionine (R)-S-oxide reductase n=1 Tax=Sphingomonas cavernae TaxID=2320861 RepID=A0A418WSK2_9SPHN|nr:peptide-methionine (R)-S-oxide reductase MsrB [Sphingomonas cavernae]RJF94233.1 peptide-methionine (R)-S-oxide reductase [Sphingomonas cavernae]